MNIKKILVILLIITFYFNIGHWGGKSFHNARGRYYHELNLFQKFQVGPNKWVADHLFPEDIFLDETADIWVSTLFWIVGCLGSLLSWLVYLVLLGGAFKWIYLPFTSPTGFGLILSGIILVALYCFFRFGFHKK